MLAGKVGMQKLKTRERVAIIKSLAAGVVPRVGLQHIQVGRSEEVAELEKDLDDVKDEAAAIRFIIGEYGSGKSFLLNLASATAHAKNFVTMSAELSSEKLLYSSDGRSRLLYSELVLKLATKMRPNGGALQLIIERWISNIIGVQKDVPRDKIHQELAPLREYLPSYDFSTIICEYYEAYMSGDDDKRDSCLRWLRGEYATKTEAKKFLRINTIIDDKNYYEYLKMLAKFINMAGFAGLLICIDEIACLMPLVKLTREKNYDKILGILNDCLQQGAVSGLAVMFASTSEFLEHKQKGLYSNTALRGRLEENSFADDKYKDLSGPVIRLSNLNREDLTKVCKKVRAVFASYEESKYLIDDQGIKAFLLWIYERMGAEDFLTPREALRKYIHLLKMLEKHPEKKWSDFITSPDSNK